MNEEFLFVENIAGVRKCLQFGVIDLWSFWSTGQI